MNKPLQPDTGSNLRIGLGFDCHRFVEERDLIIGGVKIDYSQGLDGWSDADVLSHAIADALLGASGLDDIGAHFPPGDDRFKDISSLVLLKRVSHLLKEAGFEIINIDAVVILEEPRISSYYKSICENVARALAIDQASVSVKATTTERLGLTGRKEGVASQAVALVKQN